MVSSKLSAGAVLVVVAVAGPAWSATAGCPMQSTASEAIESSRQTSPSAMAGATPLDEFADRHFLTYLKLKEKP